ncbi:hypothetical protein CYMTET_36573 [Cymbomonas tetramitiformis]|uniref:RyR/IP3R Homology associated domain-containing protein n=1 Tax=Cymbomonas tetramitiformis TaxID=36881 RepID=A0AAE0CFQ3_9CHLO|nr:hypothetical protein CYMTET_36573 [Cymbomonas tetramitiformis]
MRERLVAMQIAFYRARLDEGSLVAMQIAYRVWEAMPFLLAAMHQKAPAKECICSTIQAAMEGNETVCDSLDKAFYNSLLRVSKDRTRNLNLLRCLSCSVSINGNPIPKNQALVLQLLWESQARVCLLYNSPEGHLERLRHYTTMHRVAQAGQRSGSHGSTHESTPAPVQKGHQSPLLMMVVSEEPSMLAAPRDPDRVDAVQGASSKDDGPEGVKDDASVTAASSLLPPSEAEAELARSQLEYHSQLVMLLADCSEGESPNLKLKARKFFTFKEAIDHIIDCGAHKTPKAQPGEDSGAEALEELPDLHQSQYVVRTKKAFVRFLHSVYLAADDATDVVGNAGHHRVMSHKFSCAPGGIPPRVSLLSDFLADTRVADREDGAASTVSYLLQAALPCFHAYIHLPQMAHQAHQEMMELYDRLKYLFRRVKRGECKRDPSLSTKGLLKSLEQMLQDISMRVAGNHLPKSVSPAGMSTYIAQLKAAQPPPQDALPHQAVEVQRDEEIASGYKGAWGEFLEELVRRVGPGTGHEGLGIWSFAESLVKGAGKEVPGRDGEKSGTVRKPRRPAGSRVRGKQQGAGAAPAKPALKRTMSRDSDQDKTASARRNSEDGESASARRTSEDEESKRTESKWKMVQRTLKNNEGELMTKLQKWSSRKLRSSLMIHTPRGSLESSAKMSDSESVRVTSKRNLGSQPTPVHGVYVSAVEAPGGEEKPGLHSAGMVACVVNLLMHYTQDAKAGAQSWVFSLEDAKIHQVVAQALDVMRCVLYVDEPILGTEKQKKFEVPDEHVRANQHRFITGSPPQKLGNSASLRRMALQHVQEKYVPSNAAEVGLKFLSHSNVQVSDAAMQLTTVMMHGGNQHVLNRVYWRLAREDTESKSSTQQLFNWLHSQISNSSTGVEDYAQVVTGWKDVSSVDGMLTGNLMMKASIIPKMTAGASTIQVKPPKRVRDEDESLPDDTGEEKEDEEEEEASDSSDLWAISVRLAVSQIRRSSGVLRLMQLFMEGQHSSMQRLMHEQAHCMQSYDLVSAVANVLDELQLRTQELIMDGAPHVLLLMIQAFHTLTECVQGPCPQNQQLLSASNLTKTINNMMRLLLPDRYEAVWSTAEMLPFNIYIRPLLFDDWGCTVPIPRLCSYLRTSILHTLKAVLEGGGRHIAVMVLQKLHLTNLQDQMLSIFNVLHERDAASRNLCAAMANASESDQLLDEGLWRAPCKGTWPASRGAEDIAGSAGEWVAPQPGHGMHEIDALEEHAQIGVKEVLHKEGYHYISLLKMLMLFDEAHFEVVSSMLKHMKSTVPTVHAFFENMVASVEVKHLDTVQKAFFPMPEQCSVVRQDGPWVREMEQRFVRMTHTSTQEKAHSFQQIAQIGAFQTAYLYSLLMEKRTRILLRHRSVIVNMPFWLSCLICTVLALFHDQEGSVGPDFKFKLDPDKIVIAMLGVLHVVATALALCKYVYVDAPGMLCEIKHRSLQNLQRETKFRRKANRKLTVEELQTTHQKAAGEASTWYTQFVELLAADSRFLVDLASLLASLLAFFTSPRTERWPMGISAPASSACFIREGPSQQLSVRSEGASLQSALVPGPPRSEPRLGYNKWVE